MDIEKLDKKLKEYADRNKIFGVCRITLKDEILYQQHYGYENIENKTPFRDDSMFSFYSMTKPLCAIGLLKLYDRGLVDLSAHPGKYVPEAAGFDSRITIRHILWHISGIPDYVSYPEYETSHKPAPLSRIRKDVSDLAKYPQLFAPGTDNCYANINYTLAGLICEDVSGMPYKEYMEKEVFRPIGMKTAVVDQDGLILQNRVSGHEIDENGNVRPVSSCTDFMFGAGDVLGTVDDAYCLNLAYKHKLLLAPDTWKMVMTPNPVNGMGFGNRVNNWHGKLRIQHNGGHVGFRTYHIWVPEDDFDMILLSNSGYGNARNDMSEIVHTEFYGDNGTKSEAVEMDKGYIK